MANRLASCISTLIVLASPLAAFAQVPDIWSAAGVTAIVDDSDQRIHQFNRTGSISIKSSVASGTLVMRFPVHTMPGHDAPDGACTELSAVLRDTGPGVRVIVRLMQLGLKSGFEGQLTSLGEIDSDTTPRGTRPGDTPTSYARYKTCLNVDNGAPFDFSFFNYYVEALLMKTAAGGNPGPGLKSVQICHTEEQCEP
jgi:hypothetical protein